MKSELIQPKMEHSLRTGKWTVEEEEYTMKLIDSFLSGCLGPIVEKSGRKRCSLRTFLSQKLHCCPMRISKKFPGYYYLGVRYEQQIFCTGKIAAQLQILDAYEKEYLEKDVDVQIQRIKRRKYSHNHHSDTRNNSNSNLISNEVSSADDIEIAPEVPVKCFEPSKSKHISDKTPLSLHSTESILSNQRCRSFDAHDSMSISDSAKDCSVSYATSTDLMISTSTLDEVNSVMMMLANAAEFVEEEDRRDKLNSQHM
mmetsp:Transcript_14260/g.14364  ORF Transcript_14260/g.14364 Transcript_14260/m.14364 type:complete len:256 (+) Transcript_14260:31-798(+)